MLKTPAHIIIPLLSFLLIATFSSSSSSSSSSIAKSDEGLSSKRQKINRQKIKLQVPEKFKEGVFKKERWLTLPEGLEITLFAAGLGKVRFMAVGPDGHIYATVPKSGKVLVLPDRNKDGVADEVILFARRLDRPHGLAFKGKKAGELLKLKPISAMVIFVVMLGLGMLVQLTMTRGRVEAEEEEEEE